MKYTVNNSYHYSGDNLHDHMDYYLSTSKKYNRQQYHSMIPNKQLYFHQKHNYDLLKSNQNNQNDYDYWTRIKNQQNLLPGAGIGMSHKRYLTEYQDRYQKSKYLSKHPNLYLNNSEVPYPYTYTEYESLKQKMQQKRQAEQKWLENQISRLKKQDDLYERKSKKDKNSGKKNKFRSNDKKQTQKIPKDQLTQKIINKSKKFLDQEIYKEQHGNIAIWKNSRNKYQKLHQKNGNIQSNAQKNVEMLPNVQKKLSEQKYIDQTYQQSHPQQSKRIIMKSQIHQSFHSDHNKYLSNKSLISNNQSIFKKKYGSRYSYINRIQLERYKTNPSHLSQISKQQQINKMITHQNALIFDQLKQCQSEQYEEEQNIRQKVKISSNKTGNSHLLAQKPRKEPLNDQQESQKTPQKRKQYNKEMLQSSSKYSRNLSDIKHQRRYLQLLANLERRDEKRREKKNKAYSKYLVFHTEDNKQPNSSINQEQQKNFKSIIKQKLFSNKNQIEQMDIYKADQQHFPVFSPYTDHKHFPHSGNQYLFSSSDGKKTSKHYRALEQKRQAELKGHNVNLKELIVDEIEKKKISMKQQNNNLNSIISSQPHRLDIGTPDSIGNSLKIQLQIIKQQLEEKNKKVVDLQSQLVQLKNVHALQKKSMQHENFSTSQHIEEQRNNFKEVNQCKKCQQKQVQTIYLNQKLEISHLSICQVILPDKKKQMQRNQEKKKLKSTIQKLQQKLQVQQQAMSNFLEDIQMYQGENQQLQRQVKCLKQKSL